MTPQLCTAFIQRTSRGPRIAPRTGSELLRRGWTNTDLYDAAQSGLVSVSVMDSVKIYDLVRLPEPKPKPPEPRIDPQEAYAAAWRKVCAKENRVAVMPINSGTSGPKSSLELVEEQVLDFIRAQPKPSTVGLIRQSIGKAHDNCRAALIRLEAKRFARRVGSKWEAIA